MHMNAVTAFENRKDALRAQLEQADSAAQAVTACTMALEQISCELAQDEQDELARQRQQAVLALSRRAPLFLRPARAEGRMVIRPAEAKTSERKQRWGVQAAGVLVLAALAAYELIDGQAMFALLQVIGVLLMLLSGMRRPARAETDTARAEGVIVYDAAETVRAMGELCQAVDICVSDLALIGRDGGALRLSGTVDDATLDLLCALMEAKASGRDALAMRSLSQVEQYLHMLGIEPVFYSADQAAMFDLLPTLSGDRTVRPALVKEGRLLRRGVAACGMERSVGA